MNSIILFFSKKAQSLAIATGLLLAAGATIPLHAQSGPSITGTLLDPAGKAIPNASVLVKNDVKDDAAKLSRTVKADNEGHFAVTDLPAGLYTLEASAPGFAPTTRNGVRADANPQELSITLNVASASDSVTVDAVVSLAAQAAPSGNVLDATAPKTDISGDFIRNFESPVADFTEIVQIAPGTFSTNTAGVGLGQAKTYFRGFGDGQYTMTFDGIPFEDTNSPTHHAWANFPGLWIGGVDFDRSPGQASNFGPTNFGGSINLQSKELQSDQDIRVTGMYGSFNTRMLALDYDSGDFGPDKKSSLLINLHQLLTDGYQTYNGQKRVGGDGKYRYRLSDRTTITVFGGLIDDWNNTPNTTNPLRYQVALYGDNYLMSGDPTSPYYYGYNLYHLQTDFEYVALNSDLGDGWRFDDRAYTSRYWNNQYYNNGATLNFGVANPTGVDKLNGYRHVGDTATMSKETKRGVFRFGAWYDWSYTDRYQYQASPLTWAPTPFPTFHEHYTTQAFQPFAEYEFRATSRLTFTAGVKDAHYGIAFNQFQDIGTVLCLGGTLVKATSTTPAVCNGGAPFTSHAEGYNSWLPNATARYRISRYWSTYAQFAEGSVIPPTSVYDVAGGSVLTPPQPTVAKAYQVGSVIKFNRWTLDADAYYVHFQNAYTSYIDPSTNEPVFYLTGPSNTKGIEAESSFFIGHGFNLYLNGTLGAAKYQQTGLWVANTPHNTEAASLTYRHKDWDVGLVTKRVGPMSNDNGTYIDAIQIDPFTTLNMFFNYTIKTNSFLRGSKFSVGATNLTDNRALIGVTPATKNVAFVPGPNDQVSYLAGRAVMVSLTVGYAPKR